MRAIMISDKPKWCALMMNGDKTVEVRTSKALANAIQKLIDENGYADIYVYCSKDKKNYLYGDKSVYEGKKETFWCQSIEGNGIVPQLNGKVLFKFRCYKVEEIDDFDTEWCDIEKDFYSGYATKTLKGKELYKKSCLNEDKLWDYLNDKKGYAIHISNLEIFDRPKELSEFKKPRYCNCKLRCDNNLEHSFCREVCSHNLDSERLSVCCDRDGWVKEYTIGNMYLTKAPQNFCYIESEE